MLVLKCEQGFVGYKMSSSLKMECNKANYETIRVERGEQGQVYFRGTDSLPLIEWYFLIKTHDRTSHYTDQLR